MPLLKNKPFQKYVITNLKPDEKIFYCKITNEAFRHYDAYYERILLCNSSCWSCEMTGKQNLTYTQALESEAAARKALNNFPKAIQKPILYVASLANKSSLNELSDDVFKFVKSRYFVGEIVDVIIDGTRKKSQIKEVIPPKDHDSASGKIEHLGADPDKYRYEVSDLTNNERNIVTAPHISREKGSFTKPLNKLFLKQNMENKNGSWKIKDKTAEKLQIKPNQNVLNGPPPIFDKENKVKKNLPISSDQKAKVKHKKQEKESKPLSQPKTNTLSSYQPAKVEAITTSTEKKQQQTFNIIKNGEMMNSFKLTPEEKALIKEKQKQRLEEKKMKEKEEKAKERERKREEKRLINKYIQEWKKPREDLECEDHKPLPPATPLDCPIPQNCFGDFMYVLDFLHNYGDAISLKDTFPQGLSFDLLEKALVEKDIQGPLFDLLTALLTTLIQVQSKGFYEDSDFSKEEKRSEKFRELICQALETVKNSKACQGTPLSKLPLDSFTISEVLRLHILTSGSASAHGDSDLDPALWFIQSEPHIISQLSQSSIFELDMENKLKILRLLVDQLLMTDIVKDAIEENVVKLKKLENDLRQLHWNFAKYEKQETKSKKNGEKDKTSKDDDKEKTEDVESPKEPPPPIETPEEIEKRLKEKARKKEEFLRKEKDLKVQIFKTKSSTCVTPLGFDRSYRMFYIFNSVPGLFVVHDYPFVGECLPKPTPINSNPFKLPIKDDLTLSLIKKYIQKNTSDILDGKENETSDWLLSSLKQHVRPSSKQTVLNPKMNFNVSNSIDDESRTTIKEEENSKLLISGLCTGCHATCHVHNLNLPRTKWAFFSTETEVNNLISNLNPRGTRECHLRRQLEQSFVMDAVKDCPVHRLNRAFPPPPVPELRKSQRNQLRYESEFSGMEPREALETSLCDLLLEIEEKIHTASLGHLQVPDRDLWRENLENRHYSEKEELDESGNKIVKKIELPLHEVVTLLANCLLQIAQGVEQRFLRPPLGETEEFKKKKQKYQNELAKFKTAQKAKEENLDDDISDNLPDPPKAPVSTFERWSQSLTSNVSSLSHIFVHLYTLETSIAWDRSLLKVSCKVCRRKGDSESMLLCEGCDRGYHTHCLKPPLKEIPKGEWFCTTCKPREMPTSPRKRNILDEEDEFDVEYDTEESNEDEEEEEEQSEDDSNEDVCDNCNKGGHLICCDNCPLSFHLECIDPPLKRVPRGIWNCPKCTNKSNKRRALNPMERSSSKKPKYEEYSTKRKLVPELDFNYVVCEEIIEALFKHPDSWPFRRSVTKRDAPDYFDIIKNPMDLGTVRHKLRSMVYKTNEEFMDDIWLTLDNCELYNPQKSDEYKAGARLRKKAKELEALFEKVDFSNSFLDDSLSKRKRRSN